MQMLAAITGAVITTGETMAPMISRVMLVHPTQVDLVLVSSVTKRVIWHGTAQMLPKMGANEEAEGVLASNAERKATFRENVRRLEAAEAAARALNAMRKVTWRETVPKQERAVVEAEPALSATRKATWQETVPTTRRATHTSVNAERMMETPSVATVAAKATTGAPTEVAMPGARQTKQTSQLDGASNLQVTRRTRADGEPTLTKATKEAAGDHPNMHLCPKLSK